MGFGQILTRRSFPLDQVRNGVEAKPIDTELQPELHDVPHLFAYGGVVVIQIRLVTEETMPVVGLGNRIPSPVRHLRVDEDDSGSAILRIGIAPRIPVAFWIVSRATRFLEPRVLIGSVVGDQLDDDPDAAIMSNGKKGFEVL